MKFTTKLLAAILCIFMLVPMFVACGDTPETPTQTESTSESESVVESTPDTDPDSDTPSDTTPETDINTESTPDTDAPEVSDTDAPEVSDTDAPEVSDTDAPEVSDTDAPEGSDTDAPEVSDTDAPVDTDIGHTHTPKVVEGTPANCEETGLTEGSVCEECGEVLVAQEEIPALGHSFTNNYGSNKTNHWLTCDNAGCRERGKAEPHLFANGSCFCGRKASAPTIVGANYDAISVNGSVQALLNFSAGNVGGSYTTFSNNSGNAAFTLDKIEEGAELTVAGWIGYNVSISSFGYVINGDYANVYPSAALPADEAVQALAGANAKRFTVSINTIGLDGAAKISLVVMTPSGIFDFATIDIADIDGFESKVEVDTAKPKVNVIILSGQSNAYGASPIMDSIINRYGSKNYSNIYIHFNNINVNPADEIWRSYFSNEGFEQYRLHMGGQGTTHFGPELGIAEYLSTNRPDELFYIIKFTAAGTVLNGQWVPNDGNGFDPYGLIADMGNLLYIQMRDYIEASLAMIAVNYNPVIEAFMWMQGESDSGTPNMAESYAKCERLLVNSLRSDFGKYAGEKGIAYIDGAISSTSLWPFHQLVNDGKMSNCGVIYDPTFDGNKIAYNDEAGLENSFFIYTDSLITKAEAGEDKYGAVDGQDNAHYASESMFNLGTWFAYGYDYLMGDIAE